MMDKVDLLKTLQITLDEFIVLQENAHLLYEAYVETVNKNSVRYRYGVGCESMHLGYYCPSLVLDLIVGGCRRGKIIKKKPTENGKYIYEYAFDEQGRLLRANNEYFVYQENIILTYTMTGKNESKYYGTITRSTYENGRLMKYEQCTGGSLYVEEYQYSGDLLVGVNTYDYFELHAGVIEGNDRNGMARVNRYAISTLPDGAIEQIICTEYRGSQSDQVIYTRPKKVDSLDRIERRLMNLLVESIPKTIQTAGVSEPVYALIIAYDLEHDPMPPFLAVAVDSDRTKLQELYGPVASALFSGADTEHFWIDIECDAEEFAGLCGEWNERVQESLRYDRANRLMLQLYRKLLNYKWAGILNLMENFIIIATDLSMMNLAGNIRALGLEDKLAAMGIALNT